MKYACIASHRGEFPLRLMCRILDVSRSGFYAWLDRPMSSTARSNERLKLEIRALHSEVDRRYGAIKVQKELNGRGVGCGRNRVARLMRECGLKSKRSKKFVVTTESDHGFPVARNELLRKFDLSLNREADRVWASDITYLWTREGWLYLAVVMDLSSRRIVGWSLDHRLERFLPLSALSMAMARRRPRVGLLHHSDRGSQYASREYRELLEEQGARASMSRLGNCWDNAVVESFFATLKAELATDADWRTREEAKRSVVEYIDLWYNRKRRHQTLDYLTPVQYEHEVLKRADAA
jgi:putative transposase